MLVKKVISFEKSCCEALHAYDSTMKEMRVARRYGFL